MLIDVSFRFFFNHAATTHIYTLSLHDALPISSSGCGVVNRIRSKNQLNEAARAYREGRFPEAEQHSREAAALPQDRKSTRLNSSHLVISYAVFCLNKITL